MIQTCLAFVSEGKIYFLTPKHLSIMPLQVIGAGWGRTGTESLKKALEILGYNKCYHMFELMKEGSRLKYWEELDATRYTDFDALFEGYSAAVDFPVASYYKELMVQYPEAKIVLTVRDPDKWLESASKTILKKPPQFLFLALRFLSLFSKKLGTFPQVYAYAERTIHKELLQNRLTDGAFLKAKLKEWNEEVIRSVPAERLLVYEVKDGWAPLCNFLEKPIPEIPFPRANDSDAFQKRLKLKALIKDQTSSAA